MNNITILIHSHNYTDIIDCVNSAKLLSLNILVIGEEKRKEIVGQLTTLGARIINFPNSGIVETAREFGINQVKTEWVFLLDADERITPELAKEIINLTNLTNPTNVTYYRVPRKEIVFKKKWLKYGGWWPNYQIRLIKKTAFVSWPKTVHSTPIIKGDFDLLMNPLLHYSQNDFEEIVSRTIKFENRESDLLFKAGRKTNVFTFFRKFSGELIRRLFIKFGFLDGEIGIIESIYQAFSKTITYIYLYEKSRTL